MNKYSRCLGILIKIDNLLSELEKCDPYGDLVENFADCGDKYPPVTKRLIEMVQKDMYGQE